MRPSVIAQVLAALEPGAESINANKLGGAVGDAAARLGDRVTQTVMSIRDLPKSQVLRDFGRYLYTLIGQRHVATAIGPEVETLSCVALIPGDGASTQILILVPLDWVGMAARAPLVQAGAMVFAGSLAIDHFNGRLLVDGPEGIQARAHEWEAEYLREIVGEGMTLSEYQREVLAEHPDGWTGKRGYPRKALRGKD